MRTSMPYSAARSRASSRSRELAEKPPPMTSVRAPRDWQASNALRVSTSFTASEKEAAMSSAGKGVPSSWSDST